MSGKPYVLGTGMDELARLAMQAQLWSDAAHASWLRAGVQLGRSVLDIGCGPGYATTDLAQLVTAAGSVVGIDESAAFVEHLREQASRRGLGNITGLVGDVQTMAELPGLRERRGGFDAAFCRWVLCFVARPEAVVRSAAELLRPGGRLVVFDYFGYQSMELSLRSAAWRAAVDATAESWRARGGDPDIVGRLPVMAEAAGMEVESIRLHHRVARGPEPMFTWVHEWWRVYTPKLVEMGRLTEDQHRTLMADLEEVRNSSAHFAVCPPVYEVIVRKR